MDQITIQYIKDELRPYYDIISKFSNTEDIISWIRSQNLGKLGLHSKGSIRRTSIRYEEPGQRLLAINYDNIKVEICLMNILDF